MKARPSRAVSCPDLFGDDGSAGPEHRRGLAAGIQTGQRERGGPWFLMVPFPAAVSVVIDVHFAGTGPQATPDADTGFVEAAAAVVGWGAWCFA